MNQCLPTLAQIKAQAKRLRQLMTAEGAQVSHSQALELLAGHHGYRDWNTLSAQLKKSQPPVQLGESVSGHYSGQPFSAKVRSVAPVQSGWWKLRLQLDAPIDVVRSAHFSGIRRQLSATINAQGMTDECISSGEPLLRLELAAV